MAELKASQADLVAKYQAILDKNGITDRIQRVLVVEPTKLKGEQFGSVCLYITLEFESGRKRELFLKQFPTNEAHIAFMGEFKLFEKEAAFFNTLLPKMQEYFKQLGTGPMDFFPNCLYADASQTLFDNLVASKGYYLVPKTERQSLQHVELTLKNLAQFHAVGYCMIKDAGGRDEFLAEYPFLAESLFLETNTNIMSMFENGLTTAVDLLTNNKVAGGEAALEKLKELRGTVIAKICQLVDPERSSHIFYTVNHGDCWNNNMLFVNDPSTGGVKHNVLVDLQLCRIGSPSLDLVYYMGTSMKQELRHGNWKRLISLYFDTLRTTIGHLKPGAEFPFTLDQFIADYAHKFPIGFFTNINMTIGAELFAEFKFEEMGDTDPMTYFNEIMNKWIVANPEKAEASAREVVAMWNEYDEIVSNINI